LGETTESLTLVLSPVGGGMGVGVPIASPLRTARDVSLYAPVLDLMQTLPTFVYLIPANCLFSASAWWPGLIATVIFVLPAPIRLTQQAGIAIDPPRRCLRRAGLWRKKHQQDLCGK